MAQFELRRSMAELALARDGALEADIHIVAVTSFPKNFSKAEVLAAGCDAYLVKPLNTRRLPRQLEEVITGALPP